ncbi:MAG: FCD domain-containing protein [Rhodospirillaceae bacterium]|nr:FCD domain-containing protein [Rhodospirillaceae bacterium]
MPNSASAKRLETINDELAFIRTESLATVVQRELERMILNGEVPAGERINENMLAGKLSISRGPIREALRKLEQAGLVESLVNRGMFVRKITLEEALNLYEIRAVLAEHAGEKIAKRVTDTDKAILVEFVDRMEISAEKQDLETYYPINLEFHTVLMDLTGNPRLSETYTNMDNELQLFRQRAMLTPEGLKTSNAEHREIVERILSGDVQGAGAAMKYHVVAGKERGQLAIEK